MSKVHDEKLARIEESLARWRRRREQTMIAISKLEARRKRLSKKNPRTRARAEGLLIP